jgi:hypothetical protein
MVLRVVDDADALHGAVASGMMAASSPPWADASNPTIARPAAHVAIDR